MKLSLAFLAGTWVVAYTIKNGTPYLIPENPEPNSIKNKIKNIYETFLNSNNTTLRHTRLVLGDLYDCALLVVPLTLHLHFNNRLNGERLIPFLQLSMVYSQIAQMIWTFLIYEPARDWASRNPTAPSLASRIIDWAKPTAYKDYYIKETD